MNEITNPASQLVSKETRSRASALLQFLVQKLNGVKGAVVTTGDGFEVAVSAGSEADAAKLSAMASSISAIGSMAVQESNVGKQHESITIESDEGYIFIMDIHHPTCPMILSVVTTKSALLGQVIYYSKHVVKKLSED